MELDLGHKLRARLAELARKVSEPATLRAGFLEGEFYPPRETVALAAKNANRARMGVAPEEGRRIPVATIAAIQNFGSAASGIPPRPFFSNTVKAGEQTWGDKLGKLLVENDYDARAALAAMGEVIAGEIATAIQELDSPPLAQYTIDKKGFDKPLVETGQMLSSVGKEVV